MTAAAALGLENSASLQDIHLSFFSMRMPSSMSLFHVTQNLSLEILAQIHAGKYQHGESHFFDPDGINGENEHRCLSNGQACALSCLHVESLA